MLRKMNRLIFATILSCALMIALLQYQGAIAQDSGRAVPDTGQPDSRTTFTTVDWKEKDLEDVLEYLRNRTGLNIKLEKPEYNTRISLMLKDVQVEEILNEISEKYDFYVEKIGKSNYILTKPQKISLNFIDAPLRLVLMKIAEETGMDIVMSSAVTDKTITVNLNNKPYPDALDIILKNEGLGFVREKRGVLRVTTRALLKDEKETRIYRLAYYTPGGLRYSPKVSSPWVTLNSEASGSVVTGGAGEKLKEEVLEEGDPAAAGAAKKSSSKKQDTTASGVSIVDSVRRVLSPEGVVYYNRENNLLVLTDSPAYLDGAEKIVKALDVRPHQIMIDCKIVSFSLDEVESKGLDWVQGITVSAGASGIQGILFPFHRGTENSQWKWLPSSGFTSPGPASFIQTGTLDFSSTTLVLQFLGSLSSTELIQAPHITTLDNTDAAIRIGRDIRYAEGVVTTTDTGNLLTYREASNSPVNTGIHLVVIPHVTNRDGDILLTVIPKIEDFVRFETYGTAPTELRLPITDSKIAVTRMIIKDGHTGVIGGLIEDSNIKSKHYIPGLHKIPVAGWLFKNKNQTVAKRSTVLFISPKIIQSGDMALIDQKIKEVKDQLGDLKNLIEPGKKPAQEDEKKKRRFGQWRDSKEK